MDFGGIPLELAMAGGFFRALFLFKKENSSRSYK